jgi:endonuclease YncB( thermonuclease family)
MRLKRILFSSIAALSLFMTNTDTSNAITSFSELAIPSDQVSAIQGRFISLTNSIDPLIDRTTFAREEFLRLRAETKANGPEFQAAQNFFRNQISALYKRLAGEVEIKNQSAQIFAKILKSPQMVTEYLASRPTAFLPAECPPAIALDGESIWETGTVIRVEDGDTVDVQTCRGQLNVRQIGIQAPETVKSTHFAQCGGAEASTFMKALLPVGTEVQLRSNNYASANNYEALARPYRYIFAKDAQGNFTIDVQAKLLEAGLSMWFPNDNEYVRNYQYLEILNDAAKRGVGLWSGALCKNERDKTPIGAIEIWIETDSPLPNENPFGEYVLLRNTTGTNIDLSGWSIRDTSLELFETKYAFPAGTIVKAREILTIYLGAALPNFPLAANEIALGLTKAILQNPSPLGGKYTGDGIYLQTPLLANGGGNMRAWLHRHCIPTDCPKPEWLTKNSDGTVRAIQLPQTLSIALNPQRYGLVVPDMTGLTDEQAKLALTPLQLNVTVTDRSNGVAGEKRVVEQSPKSGAILPAGGTVIVYVDAQR